MESKAVSGSYDFDNAENIAGYRVSERVTKRQSMESDLFVTIAKEYAQYKHQTDKHLTSQNINRKHTFDDLTATFNTLILPLESPTNKRPPTSSHTIVVTFPSLCVAVTAFCW